MFPVALRTQVLNPPRIVSQVSPVPEAMEQSKWSFGALTEEAEVDYINAKMREVCSGQLLVYGDADAAEEPGNEADSFDEFQPATDGNPDRCQLCREAHWTCDGGHAHLPADLAGLLRRRAPNGGVAGASTRAVTLWEPIPITPDRMDVFLISAVIAHAHRFVRRTEGDRWGVCVGVSTSWV